jgi:hypothetical protein
MAQLALRNRDICDLEVDGIVSPANFTPAGGGRA